jgi:CRISPR system Cascade subunit CasD
MAVLLIRLSGPMQSWGIQSRFSNRDTGLEPSKSGIIGLICAAMGRSRQEDITDLASLVMGVRVDWQGTIERDYQTALNVAKAGGGKPKSCEPSDRFYLADAVFLTGFEGKAELIEDMQKALMNPVWQFYLGRKAFVPGLPVYLADGFYPHDIKIGEALKTYPYLCPEKKNLPEKLRLEIEVKNGQGDKVKQDSPISFSERRFGLRYVETSFIERITLPQKEEIACISPD